MFILVVLLFLIMAHLLMMLSLVSGKFILADLTITVGVNTGETRCIVRVFHLMTLGSHLAHLLGVCFVEFLFNDFSITIKIEVSECGPLTVIPSLCR